MFGRFYRPSNRLTGPACRRGKPKDELRAPTYCMSTCSLINNRRLEVFFGEGVYSLPSVSCVFQCVFYEVTPPTHQKSACWRTLVSLPLGRKSVPEQNVLYTIWSELCSRKAFLSCSVCDTPPPHPSSSRRMFSPPAPGTTSARRAPSATSRPLGTGAEGGGEVYDEHWGGRVGGMGRMGYWDSFVTYVIRYRLAVLH